MNELNIERVTLDAGSKICAEIYRNETGCYSFVCFYCGHIYDCFDGINAHINDAHFHAEEKAYHDNNDDNYCEEEKPNIGDSEYKWTCVFVKEEYDLAESNTSTIPNSVNENTNANEELFLVPKIEPNQTTLHPECTNIVKNKFECEYCRKKCKDKKDLNTHLSVCRITFSIPRKIKPHSENDNEKFKCHICSKILCRKSTLIAHIRIHTGEKPYSCELCNKNFTVANNLKKHMAYHLGETYKCDLCPKILSSKCNLKKHLRTHTREKLYKCKFCEKYFGSSNAVNYHMRTHKDEKNHLGEVQ